MQDTKVKINTNSAWWSQWMRPWYFHHFVLLLMCHHCIVKEQLQRSYCSCHGQPCSHAADRDYFVRESEKKFSIKERTWAAHHSTMLLWLITSTNKLPKIIALFYHFIARIFFHFPSQKHHFCEAKWKNSVSKEKMDQVVLLACSDDTWSVTINLTMASSYSFAFRIHLQPLLFSITRSVVNKRKCVECGQ